MTFEEVIRQKIAESKSKVARGVLKVVLGEFQQKNVSGKATEQDGYNIIEKIINGNKETMSFMQPEDPRLAILTEESQVVSTMLPTYLTADQVLSQLKTCELCSAAIRELFSKCDKNKPVTDVDNASQIGRATGVVIKCCKGAKLEVKGDAAKEAIIKLFAES